MLIKLMLSNVNKLSFNIKSVGMTKQKVKGIKDLAKKSRQKF